MRIRFIHFLVAAALACSVPTDSFAKPADAGSGNSNKGGQAGKGGKVQQPKTKKQVRVRFDLKPSNPALTDLAGASGKLDYQSKDGKAQYKVNVSLPSASASLGLTPETAAATAIHLEHSRDGAVINDCTMALGAEIAPVPPATVSTLQFKLHLKNQGKREVKGTCTNKLVAPKSTDKVLGYAIVNGARVDFLSN